VTSFSTSYIPASTIRDALNNTIALAAGPTSSGDTLYVALFSSSLAGGVMTDDPAHYGTGSYSSNEVYGAGWVQGGITLATNGAPVVETISNSGAVGVSTSTATSSAGVGINFTAGNISQTGTTLATAYGCVIWDKTLNSSTGPVLCAISFQGAFSTGGGTFAITWAVAYGSTTSIFYITL
jgi:hypothetical protein